MAWSRSPLSASGSTMQRRVWSPETPSIGRRLRCLTSAITFISCSHEASSLALNTFTATSLPSSLRVPRKTAPNAPAPSSWLKSCVQSTTVPNSTHRPPLSLALERRETSFVASTSAFRSRARRSCSAKIVALRAAVSLALSKTSLQCCIFKPMSQYLHMARGHVDVSDSVTSVLCGCCCLFAVCLFAGSVVTLVLLPLLVACLLVLVLPARANNLCTRLISVALAMPALGSMAYAQLSAASRMKET